MPQFRFYSVFFWVDFLKPGQESLIPIFFQAFKIK